jgi:hypothetical protein
MVAGGGGAREGGEGKLARSRIKIKPRGNVHRETVSSSNDVPQYSINASADYLRTRAAENQPRYAAESGSGPVQRESPRSRSRVKLKIN